MGSRMKLDVPLSENLARELHAFWERIFGGPGDIPLEVFLGREQEHNHNSVYLMRRGPRLAGTCNLTISKSVPTLGGFGEVATEPEFRGYGIATKLCGQAVEDFRSLGGQALFLATGNPDAARVYCRVGWRRLAGCNVMANIVTDDSPEDFLVDYFRAIDAPIAIAPATPAVRIPMIPLIVMPHDWQVLDANLTSMYSTRYCLQSSCMGLYPRYESVTEDGCGAWFAARAVAGHVVGLSTARLDCLGNCRVDGFVHKRFLDSWRDLIQAAVDWGLNHGAPVIRVLVSIEDEEKRALFESVGFGGSCPGKEFDLGGRYMRSVWMERR